MEQDFQLDLDKDMTVKGLLGFYHTVVVFIFVSIKG